MELAGLDLLIERTTEALANQISADGELYDPVDGAPTPADHYGTTFAALALAVSEPDGDHWRGLLRRWNELEDEQRGHAPFNRLALLLLHDHLRLGGLLDSETDRWIRRGLGLSPVARAYPSNNWVLLARACDVIDARREGDETDLHWHAHKFDGLCRRWRTTTGGFIDFPDRPRRGRGATPIAYHLKYLVCMALVETCSPDPERRRRLQSGLQWLVSWMDEDGYAGGFGRSTHALFGDACLLFMAGRILAGSSPEPVRTAWASRMAALIGRLEAGRREDGLLSLNPNPTNGAAGGWDDYMHLSVYNAYLAGLLAWSRAHADALPFLEMSPGDLELPPILRDNEAGLASCRGKRAEALLSLRGQPVQGFNESAIELRYGALQPWHVRLDGRRCVPPPVRAPVEDVRNQPWLAGWTPTFLAGGDLYDLHLMDWVEVKVSGSRIIAVGWCVPTRAHDRNPGRGSLRWWFENLDELMSGGRGRRRRGMSMLPLADHHAVRSLVFDGDEGWWAQLVVLRGRTSEALFLNPHGHTVIEEADGVGLRTYRVGDADEELSGREVGGPLPSALPGGVGRCGRPVSWPTSDQAFMTICGVEEVIQRDPAPAQVHLSDGELSTSWAEVSLGPRTWRGPGRR